VPIRSIAPVEIMNVDVSASLASSAAKLNTSNFAADKGPLSQITN
jgi:hypothetical protein